MIKNPVMFVTMVGAALTTVGIFTAEPALRGFVAQLAIWLWFTVLFANFAEAVAEGRGKAQAASLRKARKETMARRLRNGREEQVPAPILQKGDLVVCEAGDVIPADGDVIEGIASVDEAAITGESAPVIRESGGDRSAVTGGTRVLSDRIVIRVTMEKGDGFLDRMIALVEGARRQKTPNEIALTILLSALTFIFLLVCVTLKPFGIYSGDRLFHPGSGRAAGLPDSDNDRRIAQRHRHRRHGSRASAQRAGDERTRGRSGRRCRRAAARQDRHDHARQPHGVGVSCPRPGVEPNDLADAAQLSSLADETPEGRSIVVLAKEKFGLRAREMHELAGDIRSVHRADPHERRRSSRQRRAADHAHAQRRGGSGARIRRISRRNFPAASRARLSTKFRIAAALRWWSPTDMMTLGVDRAEGRGQRRDQGTLRAACAKWESAR